MSFVLLSSITPNRQTTCIDGADQFSLKQDCFEQPDFLVPPTLEATARPCDIELHVHSHPAHGCVLEPCGGRELAANPLTAGPFRRRLGPRANGIGDTETKLSTRSAHGPKSSKRRNRVEIPFHSRLSSSSSG